MTPKSLPTDLPTVFNQFKLFARGGLGAPLLVIAILVMMILPLPAIMLDMSFTFNIMLALIILLVTVYVNRPLEFGSFPTILLVATLLRLALNIASTRVVLLQGHEDSDAAGKVIEAFGEVVIGGNYVVGLVVFSILVIINFVVVTKGAGRISEVTARFTLDALPGKQMSIDADLNAGIITQEQARTRREEVGREADFYGAMDGASKFVRGDAVAGIIILLINMVGGLAIGMAQHDMNFSTAVERYTLLTIGDGLVAQIPSLLLSTASAIIITRVSAAEDMGAQVTTQLFNNPKPLIVTAGILAIIGLVPGMPHFAFLTLASVAAGVAFWMVQRRQKAQRASAAEEIKTEEVSPENRELSWDDVSPVDVVGLEIGYGLIPLVDANQGGQLMSRIKGVRKKLSQDLGFLIHSVHIKDNLALDPNTYRICLHGVPMGEATVHAGKDLAINPGSVYGDIEGIKTKDPTFGLDALWIEPSSADHARTLGYTVVDVSTVIATHLSQILKTHASQLLGHEEAQQLLKILGTKLPKLVEDLVPDILPLSVVVKVMQNLLQEEISLRDMRTIAETLAENGPKSQDPDVLTSVVRSALGRQIVQKIVGLDEELPVFTFDPSLEQILLQSLQATSDTGMGIEPGLAERLHTSLADLCQQQELKGEPSVLLTPALIRAGIARWLRSSLPSLMVLSYNEVPSDRKIRIMASIGA
ncbi:MAG: flagellar biosynthesis protein FlhA [Gammaproteobacteria bacterium]|nr:flagellar biosynthesis protein FlhA [Gammaproteobacteria bacterium]